MHGGLVDYPALPSVSPREGEFSICGLLARYGRHSGLMHGGLMDYPALPLVSPREVSFVV